MNTKWQVILFGAILMAAMPAASRAQQAAAPSPDGSASAQASPSPSSQTAAPHRQDRTHLLKSLNLTPEQKTQLRAIRAARNNQLQSLRNDATLTGQQRQDQLHQIRRSARRQMVALLTPDQKAQLHQIIQQRRAARMQSRQQATAPGAPAHNAAPQPDSAAPSNPSNPQ